MKAVEKINAALAEWDAALADYPVVTDRAVEAAQKFSPPVIRELMQEHAAELAALRAAVLPGFVVGCAFALAEDELSIQTQELVSLAGWLAANGLIARDDLSTADAFILSAQALGYVPVQKKVI